MELDNLEGGIEFRNVSFQYPTRPDICVSILGSDHLISKRRGGIFVKIYPTTNLLLLKKDPVQIMLTIKTSTKKTKLWISNCQPLIDFVIFIEKMERMIYIFQFRYYMI